MNDKYKDIINLPHFISKKHKQMSIENRARQFAPFDALTGYKESLFEEARITTRKHVLNNDERIVLSNKINFMIKNILNGYVYEITYFISDDLKTGGKYVKVESKLKKYKYDIKTLEFENNIKVKIEDIYDIKIIYPENVSF